MNVETIFTARRDLVEQRLDHEILIYDLQTHKMYCLNETATRVFLLCDGVNSVAEITAGLTKELKSPVSENLVQLAIEQLINNNLLENEDKIAVDFGSLTRREVIRRIGLATAVALPVISSVVAPEPTRAASVRGGSGTTCPTSGTRDFGCPCTSNGQCPPNSQGSGCCENVSSSNRTCVQRGAKEDGRFCGNNCECDSGYCDGARRSCAPFPTAV